MNAWLIFSGIQLPLKYSSDFFFYRKHCVKCIFMFNMLKQNFYFNIYLSRERKENEIIFIKTTFFTEHILFNYTVLCLVLHKTNKISKKGSKYLKCLIYKQFEICENFAYSSLKCR